MKLRQFTGVGEVWGTITVTSVVTPFKSDVTKGKIALPPQLWRGEAVFLGFGAPAMKSEVLLSVSTQPPLFRKMADVLDVAGAGEPSEKFAPSQPTRSTIVASAIGGQELEPPLQPKGAVVLTRATFPPVALRLIGVESVISGVGRGVVPPEPFASWIKKYCPGASDPESAVIRSVALPKLRASV